jgi:hypothetical protein
MRIDFLRVNKQILFDKMASGLFETVLFSSIACFFFAGCGSNVKTVISVDQDYKPK